MRGKFREIVPYWFTPGIVRSFSLETLPLLPQLLPIPLGRLVNSRFENRPLTVVEVKYHERTTSTRNRTFNVSTVIVVSTESRVHQLRIVGHLNNSRSSARYNWHPATFNEFKIFYSFLLPLLLLFFSCCRSSSISCLSVPMGQVR